MIIMINKDSSIYKLAFTYCQHQKSRTTFCFDLCFKNVRVRVWGWGRGWGCEYKNIATTTSFDLAKGSSSGGIWFYIYLIHRVVKKFSELAISIQGNDVRSIFWQHILEIVVMMFHGKFHHFNSFLRYPFAVKNEYKIDLFG
jgi:hypothetical protein